MQSDQDAPPAHGTASSPQGEIETHIQSDEAKQQVLQSGNRTAVTSIVSRPWPRQRRILPQQADERTMRAFKILLDSRMLASFLATQDLVCLSRTCKEINGAERQIRSLAPRVHPPMDLQFVGRHLLCSSIDIVKRYRQDGPSADWWALSKRALKHHKDKQERFEDGWAPLIAAMREGKMRELQRLYLVRIRTDPELTSFSFCRMASCFHQMPNLVSLILDGQQIGSEGAAALAEGLRYTPNLQELNVSRNHIGDEGAKALAVAVRHTPKLQKLVIFDCKIDRIGFLALAQSFAYTPQLQSLYIGARCGKDEIDSDWIYDISPIIKALPMMRELRVIHISGAALRNAGATWFAKWVHLLPKLEHLTLHRCAIGSSESISILTQALTQLKLLKTLDFGQNIYGVSSADWAKTLESRGFIRKIEERPSNASINFNLFGSSYQPVLPLPPYDSAAFYIPGYEQCIWPPGFYS